jgi:hypothetical protein
MQTATIAPTTITPSVMEIARRRDLPRAASLTSVAIHPPFAPMRSATHRSAGIMRKEARRV